MTARARLPMMALAVTVACSMAGRRRSELPFAGVPRYDIPRFFETARTVGAAFSADGSRILVSSDAAGVFNAYTIPFAGGELTPVTRSTTSSLLGTSFFPEDDRILVQGDQGGNELVHLFVVDPDGRRRDLTPGDGVKASFLGFSGDRRRLFVLTNERRADALDVYEIDARDYARRRIYTNDTGWRVVGVSPDGRWVALNQADSNTSAEVHVWDARDPASPPRQVAPGPGAEGYTRFGAFTHDSRELYYLTDAHGEHSEVWSIDLATGARRRVVAGGWDIELVSFSPRGRYRVTSSNQDGHSVVDLVDMRSGAEVPLEGLPAGEVLGVSFSPDESRLALYVSSDRAPRDLMVWDLVRGGHRRLIRSLSPAIDPDHLVEGRAVRYRSFDGLEIPAILYRPHGAGPRRRAPALVWVHGGPGGQSRFGYNAFIQVLVNRGYAVLAPNHRGSRGYGKTFLRLDDRRQGDVDLRDCIEARRYLAGLDWIDGSRVGIMGISFGGYMTVAALAFHPGSFEVGIDLFGPTNMVRTMESIPAHWAWIRKELVAEYGDPAIPAERERLRAISPLFRARAIRKPMLVVQGANDPRVLRAESDDLVAVLRQRGVPVEYLVFPDEGHGFMNKANAIVAATRFVAFLERHLRGAGAP